VLVSEDGANLLLRSTAIAFVADGQYWVNNHAHILEPFDGAHDFWAARIEALDISPWVTGSAQPKLTIDAAMALPMSAPAQVDTRRALGRQVVDARAAVEKRAWALEKSGTLLQEYKQSLITAAVTGELDVTTAGSGIPG
jgi:type I restriction enzyme S subunit